MDQVSINQTPNANPQYAGFWRRWLAAMIDSFIFSLVFGGLYFLFNQNYAFQALRGFELFLRLIFLATYCTFFLVKYGNLSGDTGYDFHSSSSLLPVEETRFPMFFLVFIFWVTTYYIFSWLKYGGQTLGNRVMALKVVRENGKPMDVITGIVRYIGYIISSIVFLGYIWMAFDKRKQGWHDKIAKTLVVKTEEKPKTAIAVIVLVLYFLIIVSLVVRELSSIRF